MTENGDPNVDDAEHSYRIVTFHDHRGAPPTMATSELQRGWRRQLAMRALPDAPDDPGALPIALDTEELVEALGSICAHLDEGESDLGSIQLHDGQIIIHWYLRSPHDELDATDWLPDDVAPDCVVVWWCTASGAPEHQAGQVIADRLCQRLGIPNRTGGTWMDGDGRLTSAINALNALDGKDACVVELATLTHEGATIGVGPGRHLRVAHAVAATTGQLDLWSSAMLTGLSAADELSERVLPTLSGAAEHDPRQFALAAAIAGWVAGLALAPHLRVADLNQLLGPVALVLRPHGLRHLDIGAPFATIARALLDDDANLLRSLRPAEETIDGATLHRARRQLKVALACGWLRSTRLSTPRRHVMEQFASDVRDRLRLTSLLVDACAAPLCAERAPGLAVLRPGGLPDALWDEWVESGRSVS